LNKQEQVPVSDRIEIFQYQEPVPGRLDRFLTACLPEFSRTRIQGLISEGFVTVNGRVATKAGLTLEGEQTVKVRIPPPVPSGLVGEDIPLDVIFENDDLIIVNKPAGMVVHPAVGHDSGTLVHAVLGYEPDIEGIGGEERPGVVHRLDKDTSGLIVLAKNERAHRWLVDQFRLRLVRKVYLALVDGSPPTPTGRVEAAIGRDVRDRKKMAVVRTDKGREAISEYKTLETFANYTLLEFHPQTGRTHQIRVHCAFLGCSVVGDALYGRKKQAIVLHRHFLHAYQLTITLPGEEKPRSFEAPLPDELVRVLQKLREGS
jgi:23S rRNA pseudouridine1911/1915/1917 synthase